ncbi:hypothetical protein GOBAR_AA37116 [Gossypium barbadense]|uniref:Suppressor of forked domain-containing protein n=1 Tax=Gossypium barbadense TaxID=3634 RepID=A0A2P5VXQ9_GOSBA|nr:hypothetical protein GOBAR_AA37116 [Gossypium barbadense]
MEVHISGTETETEWHPKKGNYLEGFDEQKLKGIIAEGELDFDGWTKLISEVENFFHDEIDNICLVYDSFLSEFPLCYGYWRRYADHMMRLCTIDKAVDVFERAVQSATYSIDVWVDYCGFSVSVFEDDNDIRRFQKLVATWKEEMQCPNHMDLLSDPRVENEVSSCHTDAEISCIIKELLDASSGMDGTEALAKYLSIGKQFYREASELDEKIHHFEAGIQRPYFHVKELDISQLDNWHEYLNFVEMHGDFDWAVKLYERCLIPCANYPEFWMRYVDFMESKGGREIANFALARAAEVFLKRMPVIHLFTARFKEKIRDVSGAHIALLHYEKESDLSFVETVSIKANMEKRLGNFVAASNTYKEAMEIAAVKQKFDILPIFNSDAARDILIDGIKCLPHCKLLLEELIKFGMMHGGPRDIHVLDAIINDVISLRPSQGMDAKEAEEISSLYLQFVDLCGTIDDIRKAWNRHIKCFPESARGSTYKFSVINGIKSLPLKITACRRQGSPDPLPSHPSGDRSLDIPVQSPSRDNILKPLENDDAQPNHAALDCVPDMISPFLEDHEIPLYQATVNKLQSGEVDESLQGGRQHSSEEVSNKLQSGEDINTTTNMSSHNLIQDEMRNGVEALETSEENSKENKFRQELEHKPEHDVNELPLERLSLGQLDRESLDSISFANQEGETFNLLSEQPSKLNGQVVPGVSHGSRAELKHAAAGPRRRDAGADARTPAPSLEARLRAPPRAKPAVGAASI